MSLVNEYSSYDATGLAELIRDGQTSALEVVESAIQVIERCNPELNAVVATDFDAAIDRAKGKFESGPFAGVPFLIKDNNVFVKGRVTSFGSVYLADCLLEEESDIVKAWRRSGLIFLGKTNLPEFAHSYYTEPARFGPTRNPWNPTLTPGGSSGGAAAAVASGMVPMAHANDAGGSIRCPASCCGLFGFKPSSGLVSLNPHFSEIWGGLNAEHAITKSVRDSALLLDIEVSSTFNNMIDRYHKTSYHQALERPPGQLKIAYATTNAFGVPVTKACSDALERGLALIADLGHEVIEATLPVDDNIGEILTVLISTGIAAVIEAHRIRTGRGPAQHEIEAVSQAYLEQSKRTSALTLVMARQAMHDVSVRLDRFLSEYDIFVSPTLAKPPQPIGGLNANGPSFDMAEYANGLISFCPFTAPFNLSGQPAMSVPLDWTEDDLPVGLQFAAKHRRDGLLLSFARQLEKASPWKHRLNALSSQIAS